ncbi:MAG TPA: PQQ-binding-like beta-propeller repeat protein [Fimbriiglobus sp.]|jgi:outer membrane protein assembly factor BamB|nr:PQQ-binding-like beta-propeller repeat protein [Fimbriiglobus sp.]
MARTVVLVAALFAVAADEPKLKPDPPAKAVEWPATLPEFDLPGGDYSQALLSADNAGPFVLTSTSADRGKQTTRAVFDLRTGKKVGEWKSDDPTTGSHALSPDGKTYVALFVRNQPMPAGVPQATQRTVAAYDTATGKRLWSIDLAGYANRVLFTGPDRVLIDRVDPKSGPELHDARSGKRLREIVLDPKRRPSIMAASPGGAYLAAHAAGAVILFDTATGTEAAQLTLPQQPGNTFTQLRALTFSPDGRRLAGLYGYSPTVRVVGWDLTTGLQDADAVLPGPRSYSDPILRWTADGKAWLVSGLGVIDPDTGAVLWRMTTASGYPSLSVLAPLSADRMMQITMGPGRVRRVEEVALPKGRIAAALKAVRAGGLAVDGWLPTLAKADRSAADQLTVPARADDWTYQPDPAPAAGRKPLRLPVPAGLVASAHVVGTAAVCELADPATDSFAPRHLVRVDLATGKPTGRAELPHVARLADVAPDGAAAVTVDAEDHRRLDVWDLGAGAHVAGWRPAAVREPGGELLYVSMLSADRVLTLTRGGDLAVWSVPQAKAVYTTRLPGLGVPARSPGRKYLFALQGDTVRVIEAATGKLAGDLPTDAAPPPAYPLPPYALPPGPWSFPPLALRPDGGELTALLTQPAGLPPQLRRWDLNTAKLSYRSAITGPGVSPAVSLRYAGPDHLLLADKDLLGLESRDVEWRYTRPQTVQPATSADGRYWYVVGDFSHQAAAIAGAGPAEALATAVLVAAELPHPAAVAARQAVAANTADNLLGPGKAVRLKLDLAGVPGDRVTESVRATLTDVLKERGLKATDDKAAVVLTASARVMPNGPKLAVRKLLPGETGAGTAEKVEVPYLATRLELTADGKSVWTGGEVQIPPPLNPQPFRLPAKDTDLTAWLRERSWARLSDAWGKLNLPRTLVRTPAGLVTLPGTSELGPEGPRPSEGGRP